MKAYLRYEHSKSWGVVCSPDVNVCYHNQSNNSSGSKKSFGQQKHQFLFTAAGECVNILDCSLHASGAIKRQLHAPKTYHTSDGSPVATLPRVTAIACSKDGQIVAGGFSDGSVRLWRKPLKGMLFYASGGGGKGGGGERDRKDEEEDPDELYSSDFEDDEDEEFEHCTSSVLFRGHKSAVSALAFTEDGTVLVSGGRDTDVVVWDTLEEKGLFRLKGHRGQVTSAVFVKNSASGADGKGKKARKKSKKSKKKKDEEDDDEEDDDHNDAMTKSEDYIASSSFTNMALVTTSKDGFAKVWDLVGQRCCQTLSGFGGECWASAYSEHVVADTTNSNNDNENNNNNNSNEAAKYGIVAIAGVEREIKFYSVYKGVEKDSFLRRRQRIEEEADNDDEDEETKQARENILDRALRLRFVGSFAKETRSRTISMHFSNLGTAFGVQSVGKSIEIYDVKNAEEIEKKRKRRLKRRREKENSKKLKLEEQKRRDEDSDDNEKEQEHDEEDSDEEDENKFNAKDAFELSSVVRPTGKSIAPFAFQPESMDSHLAKSVSLAICLDSNAVEVYDIASVSAKKDASVKEAKKRSMARPSGHRADVRVIALSPDETFLLSVSHSGAKIWDADTGKCARTIESGYGTCAFFAPDGRNAVVGTKDGGLEIIDCLAGTNSASLPEDEEKKKKKKKKSEEGENDDVKEREGEKEKADFVDPLKSAHDGPVWGICALPDESGFVTCSGDKTIKFWEWTLVAANRKDKNGMKKLTATHSKTLQMADDVLSISITPNGKLLSASLLDNTLKVFFADTLKFSLSLYGHRLPALCHDVSSDSVLLASAGQDKNIRVWGLDFGDCHRSIHAHDDSVMALKFVNKTHYAFTCGKDKRVRYWDLDKYEMLLSMDEHHMAVWTIAVSTTGAFIVSSGADRSLRLYERTKEPFFLDEEKEKRLDSMFEDNAGIEMDEEDRRNSERIDAGNNGDTNDPLNTAVAESGLAGRRTMETLDSADKIAAAVDLAKHELERVAAYENEKRQSADPSKMPPLKPNPLLLNMEPRQYALYQVSQVRPAELERSILCLPFLYCRLLLDYLKYWLERNEKVELCCTMTNLIVRLHFQQLGATREARATLDGLKPLLRSRAKERLDDLGFNIAGIEMIERSAKMKAET